MLRFSTSGRQCGANCPGITRFQYPFGEEAVAPFLGGASLIDLIAQLQRVVDAFGVKRLMWASDYTVPLILTRELNHCSVYDAPIGFPKTITIRSGFWVKLLSSIGLASARVK